jgi:uncharacterized membrane protein YccC
MAAWLSENWANVLITWIVGAAVASWIWQAVVPGDDEEEED